MIAVWVAVSAIAATPITLEEVRTESRANHQALLAELDHQRAEEQVRLARSGVMPQLSLNGNVGAAVIGPNVSFNPYTNTSVDVPLSATRGNFDLSIALSQLIYDGGRWWNQIAQANELVDSEKGQFQEQVLASELEGIRRFYNLYDAQESVALLEGNVKRSEEQLQRAEALFEAGRINGVDVYGAKVNLGNDRLSLAQQRVRIADAQSALAVWLKRPVPGDLVAATPTLDTSGAAPDYEQARETARKQRPLYTAVESTLRAFERGVAIARSEYLPSVSAQITAGRQGPTADPFFTDPTRQNYVQGGIGIRWDLFNGFATNAQVQQAEIERRRAEIQLRQAEREIEAELRNVLVVFDTRVAAAKIAEENVDAATKGLELANARFEAGAGSTIEVRDAQLKLTQSELSLLRNRIDVELARAAVNRALGVGVTQ